MRYWKLVELTDTCRSVYLSGMEAHEHNTQVVEMTMHMVAATLRAAMPLTGQIYIRYPRLIDFKYSQKASSIE